MASMPETIINVVTIEGTKASLQAGDTLIFTLPHAPTKEQAECLTAYATKCLPDGVKVLVLGKDISFAVASGEGGDSLMCEIKALRQEIQDLRHEQRLAAQPVVCG